MKKMCKSKKCKSQSLAEVHMKCKGSDADLLDGKDEVLSPDQEVMMHYLNPHDGLCHLPDGTKIDPNTWKKVDCCLCDQ